MVLLLYFKMNFLLALLCLALYFLFFLIEERFNTLQNSFTELLSSKSFALTTESSDSKFVNSTKKVFNKSVESTELEFTDTESEELESARIFSLAESMVTF